MYQSEIKVNGDNSKWGKSKQFAITDAISPTYSITFFIKAFCDSFGHCPLVFSFLT